MPIGRAAMAPLLVVVVGALAMVGAGVQGALLGFRRGRAASSSPIALGDWFRVLPVMKDTSVRCWGGNEAGELGDGTTASRADRSAGATIDSRASLA